MEEEDKGGICHEVSKIFAENELTFSDVVNVFHTLMIYSLDHDPTFPPGTDTAKASYHNSPHGKDIDIITTFIMKENENFHGTN